MKKLIGVEVIFENCENVCVDIKDIVDLSFDGISKSCQLNADHSVLEYDSFRHMTLSLKNTVNYISRLIAGDISQVILNYENGDTSHFFVPYEDKEERLGSPNKYQSYFFGDHGVTIVINSDET